ncbi:MAG: GxxExxY protein [Anaerolineales bacterium]
MTEKRKKFEGKHSDLTGKIIGAFFQLHKEMGYGFSEKVYQTAFTILLEELDLFVEQQKSIKVYFHKRVVGEYFADIVVNNTVLLELKAVEKLADVHSAQLSQLSKSN